jgi:hypothetical protein
MGRWEVTLGVFGCGLMMRDAGCGFGMREVGCVFVSEVEA